MTPKELKKLVKLCRDMGVKSYKGEGFEFTLTDEAPVKTPHKAFINSAGVQTDDIESDTLTPEQIMWWSAVGDSPFPVEDKT